MGPGQGCGHWELRPRFGKGRALRQAQLSRRGDMPNWSPWPGASHPLVTGTKWHFFFCLSADRFPGGLRVFILNIPNFHALLQMQVGPRLLSPCGLSLVTFLVTASDSERGLWSRDLKGTELAITCQQGLPGAGPGPAGLWA